MIEPLENRRLLSTGTLTLASVTTISSGSKFDLSNNKLIVSSGSSGTSYDGVLGLVQTGRNSGGTITGIGVASAIDVAAGQWGTQLFGGQTVSGSDTLVMYTYTGDGNLDGIIDGPSEFSGTGKNDRIIVSFDAGRIAVTVNDDVTVYTEQHNLRINANAGDDLVSIDLPEDLLDSVHVTVYGAAGNDTIIGSTEPDRIFAGDGNDLVIGNGGKDTIYGDEGDDSIRGGGSNDLILGGDGNDTLRGDAGNDNINGGANSDRLRGSAGNDTLEGGGGRDLLAGEGGDDSLDGGNGPDAIDGGAGADTLRGGADVDSITNDESDDLDAAEIDGGEMNTGGFNRGGGSVNTVNTGTPGVTLRLDTGTSFDLSTSSIVNSTGESSPVNPALLLNTSIHAAAGSVVDFSKPTGGATLKALELDAGSYLAMNISGTSSNALNITGLGGGFINHGGTIKLRGRIYHAGKTPLITFAGAGPELDLKLLATPPDGLHYALSVDQPGTRYFWW
jgi:Ca2+-binding RTX toxin-like protein